MVATPAMLPRNNPPKRAGGDSYEEFHPYGTTAWISTAGVTVSLKRYKFTGMERDEETGLQCHGVRYYAPWLGRWTSADPIGLGDGVNRFGYCHGGVVGATDSGGLGAVDTHIARSEAAEWARVEPKPVIPPASLPPPDNETAFFTGMKAGVQYWAADNVEAGVSVLSSAVLGPAAALFAPFVNSLGKAFVVDEIRAAADSNYAIAQAANPDVAEMGLAYGYLLGMLAELLPLGPAAAELGLSGAARAGVISVGEYAKLTEAVAGLGHRVHHLVPHSVVKEILSRGRGLSVVVEEGGDAFQRSTRHGKIHASMERFFDQFRKGGARAKERPTWGEVNSAALDALVEGGFERKRLESVARLLDEQMKRLGYSAQDQIPRVPRRMNQRD